MPAIAPYGLRILVDGVQLEEHNDDVGRTYVAIPLNGPSTYQVDFEEVAGGEACIQKWPVTPYCVEVYNSSEHCASAHLYVDGQKVDKFVVQSFSHHVFSSVAISSTERKELLFSLPRFATQAEQQRQGGQALTPEQIAELGTIQVKFYKATKSHIRPNVPGFKVMSSFTQGNKADSVKKGGAAATTRLGKVIETAPASSSGTCTVYNREGNSVDVSVLYRTHHYLIEQKIVADPNEEQNKAEREIKRAAKRKRNRKAADTKPALIDVSDETEQVKAETKQEVVEIL